MNKTVKASDRPQFATLATGAVILLALMANFSQLRAEIMKSAPSYLWIREAGGPHAGAPGYNIQDDLATAVAADGKGSVFVTGTFAYRARFGNLEITSPPGGDPDNVDLFLVKYDPTGTPIWVKHGGGMHPDALPDVVATADGGVIWAGLLGAPADVDGQHVDPGVFPEIQALYLNAVADSCYFVAKYDANGNQEWLHFSRSFTAQGLVPKVAVDPAGAVYLLGSFFKLADFEGTLLTYPGYANNDGNWANSFVAKYDASGQFQWVKRTSVTQGFDSPCSLAVDAEGNLYLGGSVDWTITLGGAVTLTKTPFSELPVGTYIAKLDSMGTGLWAQVVGGSRSGWPNMKIDGSGHVYTCAQVSDAGGISLSKFDPYGRQLWQKTIGAGSPDYAAFACDADGNTVVAGWISALQFNSLTGQHVTGDIGNMLLSFGSSGELRWARYDDITTTISRPDAFAIAENSTNSWFVAGRFFSQGMFDGISFRSPWRPLPDVEDWVARLGYPATNDRPLITAQPEGVTVFEGLPIKLQVADASIAPVSYQWFYNGMPIADSASNVLTFTNVTLDAAGSYSVRVVNTNGATDSVAVKVAILPLSRLGEALNATNLAWRLGGAQSWKLDTNVTHDGVVSAVTPYLDPVLPPDDCWIETTVQGPGVLSYWWKTSTKDNSGYPDHSHLGFLLDDVEQYSTSGLTDWKAQSLGIGAGTHRLRWDWLLNTQLEGTDGATVNDNLCWLDQVTFQPVGSGAPQISAATQLPSGQFQFTINGPAGARYGIEACSDLNHWVPIGQIDTQNGVAVFTHVAAPGFARHYYRAVLMGP